MLPASPVSSVDVLVHQGLGYMRITILIRQPELPRSVVSTDQSIIMSRQKDPTITCLVTLEN